MSVRDTTEPNSVLDMQGLIYRRRYDVDRDMGERLEGSEYRAEKEQEVAEQIRSAGPLFGTPLVSLEPAGFNLVLVVELGSNTISPLDRSKGDLDAAMDTAMEEILDASHERALDSMPDETPWELRCR
jgi:hypothetical protein